MVAHRAAGGRAAFVTDRTIMLASGAIQTPVGHLPEAQDGCAMDDEAALAAVAAAWACGVDPDVIVTGVATFGSDLDPYSGVAMQMGAQPVSAGAR
jgi:cyanophycin synthetase